MRLIERESNRESRPPNPDSEVTNSRNEPAARREGASIDKQEEQGAAKATAA